MSDLQKLLIQADNFIDSIKDAIKQLQHRQASIQYDYNLGYDCDDAYQRNEDALDHLNAALESIKDAKGYIKDASQD